MLLKIFKWLSILSATLLVSVAIFKPNIPPKQLQNDAIIPVIQHLSSAIDNPQIARYGSLKVEKPTTPRNPKYVKRLTAANDVQTEDDKVEVAWDNYDQQECSDKTLAANKKQLKIVQTARLKAIQNKYKNIVKHNEGDVVAVIRAKQYIQYWASTSNNNTKLIYTTACLEKRGDIPKAASDLNVVQSVQMVMLGALVDAYDSQYSSDSLLKFDTAKDNYIYKVLSAEEKIKAIK